MDRARDGNMEYMVHLNHEELMINHGRGEDLIRNEGSFFRCMRYVGVPGIDNLNQIRPGSVCTLKGAGLKNLSEQVYRAVIVPTSTVIQKKVLERLRAFAAAGGKVVFVGRTPSMVVDRTFLNPRHAPDLSFATLESAPEITPRVVAALPKQMSSSMPPVRRSSTDLGCELRGHDTIDRRYGREGRRTLLAGTGAIRVQVHCHRSDPLKWKAEKLECPPKFATRPRFLVHS